MKIVRFAAKSDQLSGVIKNSAEVEDQYIVLGDGRLIVLFGRDISILHFLTPEQDQTVTRLLALSSAQVQQAFIGRDWQDAVKLLAAQEKQASPAETERYNQIIDRQISVLQRNMHTTADDQKRRERRDSLNAILENTKITPESDLRQAKPWNPGWISILTFIFTPVVIGTAYGLNWRRLRRPRWVLPTIIMGVLTTLLIIGGTLATIDMLDRTDQIDPSANLWVLIAGLVFCVSTYIAFPMVLHTLQYPAYEAFRANQSSSVLDAHRYRLIRTIGIAVLSILGLTIGATVFAYIDTRPTIFENNSLRITYPNTFARVGMAGIDICQNPDWECQLALQDSEFGFSWVVISRTQVPQDSSIRQIANNFMRFENENSGLDIQEDIDTEVGGKPAVQYFGYYAIVPPDDDRNYVMNTLVIYGNYLYQIWSASENRRIFREDLSDFESLIAGIEFK